MTSKSTAKPAPTVGPATAPSFTFEDAPVPARTRKSTAVNPLSEVCAVLAPTVDPETGRSPGAKMVTVPDDKSVAQVKRWLALAGPDNGVTFRSTVEKVENGQRVTFWAVSRITQNRKPKIAQ